MARFEAFMCCPITKEVMADPVVDAEGNSFERSAIVEWLLKNEHSPLTRTPMRVEQLAPNRSLREAIEAAAAAGATGAPPRPERKPEAASRASMAAVLEEQDAQFVIESKVSVDPDDGKRMVLLSVKPPVGTARTPVDVCCVLDVSGSMGSEATMKGENGKIERDGLSLLDIVKHATRTIVKTMGDGDRLAIVAYNTCARTALPLTIMNEAGKRAAELAIDALRDGGGTNIWGGIETGLGVLSGGDSAATGRVPSLILLTDGQPAISPPRGETAMLQRYLDKHGQLAPTVSTYGFGYDVESKLLESLALVGGGSYAFIPDASFVGTAFVHAISNLLSTVGRRLVMKIELPSGARAVPVWKEGEEEIPAASSDDGHSTVHTMDWGVYINLGDIAFGQSRDFVMSVDDLTGSESSILAVSVTYLNRLGGTKKVIADVNLEVTCDTGEAVSAEALRLKAAWGIRQAVSLYRNGDLQHARTVIAHIISSAPSDPTNAFIKGILGDLTGQVTEALSRNDWMKRWGVHYLPSLSMAHERQQCTNFKDSGLQFYGGELFQTVRDTADELFCALPPPKPSLRTYGDNILPSGLPQMPGSMYRYNNRNNPCMSPDSMIQKEDGSFVRADHVRRGDQVATSTGELSSVLCVVRTACDGGRTDLVQLAPRLRVTPYHPIKLPGTSDWVFPLDVGTVQEQECSGVYSFVLNSGHSLLVDGGIDFISLGHGIRGPVAGHPYFGTIKVIQELKGFEGWDEGHIELKAGCAIRDEETDLICGLRGPSKQLRPPAEACVRCAFAVTEAMQMA